MKPYRRILTITAGSAAAVALACFFHLPQWTAKAASSIFSSPVSNVIEAYRAPYQSLASFVCTSNAPICTITFGGVPFFQRLTVKALTIYGDQLGIGSTLQGSIYDPNTGSTLDYFTMTPDALGNVFYRGDKLIYLNTSSGGPPTVKLQGESNNGLLTGFQGTGYAILTGYLDNCNSYPGGNCPAIVQ